ncbi:HNH endonuclease [Candidatus Pacearchaeota archaeon]|nr:HNH endonuclease [Candidatus Pacearchaeota archaeon]
MTSNQKKALDRLWQEKVTGDICSFPSCNRIGNEGHHIMKRRYLNTRWNIENGRALCRECHLWAETNPQAYEDLILAELGEIEYGRLREQALMVRKQYFKEVKEMLSSA